MLLTHLLNSEVFEQGKIYNMQDLQEEECPTFSVLKLIKDSEN